MNYVNKRILSSNDLKLMRGSEGNTFKKRLTYQLKTGKLYRIRKGLYVVGDQKSHIGENDFLVIANSIYTPSYISYETVLRIAGLVFQGYEQIFVACAYNKQIVINEPSIQINCHQMPKELLICPLGLQQKEGYTLALPERAICDVLRRNPNYYFDTLKGINSGLLKQIADIYDQFKPGFKDLVLHTIKKYE